MSLLYDMARIELNTDSVYIIIYDSIKLDIGLQELVSTIFVALCSVASSLFVQPALLLSPHHYRLLWLFPLLFWPSLLPLLGCSDPLVLPLHRFLNSAAAKMLFRAGEIEAGEKMAAAFTRDGEQVNNLNDMQCMWYEMEAGHAHLRRGAYGPVSRPPLPRIPGEASRE